MRSSSRLEVACLLAIAALLAPNLLAQNDTTAIQLRNSLNKYCVTCHNTRLNTADLKLDQVDVNKISDNIEIWEKVRRKLHEASMPPPGLPRPDVTSYKTFSSWIESELDREASAHPHPGSPAIHRLNRTEYTNAIRDLLALEINGRDLLPADDSAYGFDNVGDTLTFSPFLMDRYLAAAQKISRLAIGNGDFPPSFEVYRVSAFLNQDDRMNEDLPFGSRGGVAIQHRFPVDGEYAIRITLQRTFAEEIRGIGEPRRIDVFVDGAHVGTLNIGGPQYKYGGGGALNLGEASTLKADSKLEVRFPAKAGTRKVAVTFHKITEEPENVKRPVLSRASFAFTTVTDGNADISTVQIGGPFDPKGPGDTPSRRAIFSCLPGNSNDTATCAKKILTTLAKRAYRRPPTERDLGILMSFYRKGEGQGGFENGIKEALERILISPEFLFRIERDPSNSASESIYALSGLELASRLSFFLWSSIPDDQLLELGGSGKLKEPAILEQQVRRMLADRRSGALVTNFAGQWLWLRNLRLQTPNNENFPTWDENLREAFQRETELFVDSMIRENRGIPELLDANYTFANETLARYYGIPNIYGPQYRRVSLSDDHRRGLLGQGSILTITSYNDRTSPTRRGAWLLDNILNAPSPPPPPNVPALKDNGENGQFFSMRERMEQHRKNPVCASCHARMDPLGFALENYDAIGGWRTTEFGKSLDTAAVLPDGTRFNGVAELRKILLDRREDFAEAVTEKLMIYALGRGLENTDLPTVRGIVKSSASDGYRWSNVILGIVKSPQFQMRVSGNVVKASNAIATRQEK